MLKFIRYILLSDLVIVSVAVLLFSLIAASIVLVLTWLIYEDRYGMSFEGFLHLLF